MAEHLLAIDDVEEDFEKILKWAIEFKRLWKQGDEVALNFLPLDTLAIGSIYEKPSTRTRVSFEVVVVPISVFFGTREKCPLRSVRGPRVGRTGGMLRL